MQGFTTPLFMTNFIKSNKISVYVLVMCSLTILIFTVGIILTNNQFLGIEWFSRSGSLVVVLGIFSGLGGVLQERWLASQFALQHRFAAAKTRKKLRQINATEEYIAKELAELEKQLEDMNQSLQSKLKLKVGMLELNLLVFGTLVWGFGDIVIKFI